MEVMGKILVVWDILFFNSEVKDMYHIVWKKKGKVNITLVIR